MPYHWSGRLCPARTFNDLWDWNRYALGNFILSLQEKQHGQPIFVKLCSKLTLVGSIRKLHH